MSKDNVVLYNGIFEIDEDLVVNPLKFLKMIWNRKFLIIGIFCLVLVFFILLTFIIPKKYKVTADLYINKANSSNMVEFNPYILDETTGTMLQMSSDKTINNEIELMKSELVLDKVIKENNIVYTKIFGIFPNKKEGEYVTAKDFYGKGKNLKIENIKNTNVISVEYTTGKPELSYGVVSSLIANYIQLHKELNTEKSKADKKLLETEYAKIKEILDKKMDEAKGMPVQAMTGLGNLSAMSAFSKSASQAMGNIRSQYIAGEKSQIEVTEESQKLSRLAAKLEWAKMVEQMSDSSKVLILQEPKLLRPFEKSSPKLLKNIILGCIFGGIFSIIGLVIAEIFDKRLSYYMLTENIVFDCLKNIDNIKLKILSYNPQKILIISLAELSAEFTQNIMELPNCDIIHPTISKDFIYKIGESDKIILISEVYNTQASTYKSIRDVIQNQSKDILFDVLL